MEVALTSRAWYVLLLAHEGWKRTSSKKSSVSSKNERMLPSSSSSSDVRAEELSPSMGTTSLEAMRALREACSPASRQPSRELPRDVEAAEFDQTDLREGEEEEESRGEGRRNAGCGCDWR